MDDLIVVDTDKLDQLIKTVDADADAVLRSLAFDVEREAKKLAVYQTTAMKNSIYTVTNQEDGFVRASQLANTKRPGIETTPHPRPTGDVVAYVGPCVHYAIWVELGTHKKAARPFLWPALGIVYKKLMSPTTWTKLFGGSGI